MGLRAPEPGEDLVTRLDDDLELALYPSQALGKDANAPASPPSLAELSPGHIVRSQEEVRAPTQYLTLSYTSYTVSTIREGRSMEHQGAQRVEAVRRFNRFYTRQIGLLQETLLASTFNLTEARVVYELAHHEETTATHLGQELGLDAGYLSRILRGFQERGLVDRRPSQTDRRQQLLSLTEQGQQAFVGINAASRAEIEALLGGLSEAEQLRLLQAMEDIEILLGARPEHRVPYILRPPESGDMGWVVHRHGALYNQEYGWDETFEALVAEIVARFIRELDPRRERCWIAEREGENVGSVFLVRHPEREGVAQLRLLLVEPRARGLGIGWRLVQECTRFARQAGYHRLTLWTNNVLVGARRLYEREGYELVAEEAHHSFGHDLVGQRWELEIARQPAPGRGRSRRSRRPVTPRA